MAEQNNIQKPQNKILDFATKVNSINNRQEADTTEESENGKSNVLDFARRATERADRTPTMSNSGNRIHPAPENDPTQNENLTELQRAAIDINMLSNLSLGNRAAGYMPQSQLYSARNSLMQGLGDFFSGIGSFASMVWREATFKEQFAHARGDEATAAEDEPLYQLGQSIKNGIQEVFPENEEYQRTFATKLARAGGTLSGQVAVGMLSGGSSVIATGIMASSFSGMEYERALEETGDDDIAFQTALLNLPVNSLEAIPVFQALSRTNKMTGGLLSQTIKSAGKIGVVEAVTETGQTAASNWVASNMYDETRRITDGMAEGGAMGFILGGMLGGSARVLRGKATDASLPVSERMEAMNSYKLAKSEIEKLDMTEQFFRRTFPESIEILNPIKDFASKNKFAPTDYNEAIGDLKVGGSTKPLIPGSDKSKSWWQSKFTMWFQDKGEFSPEVRKILRDGENLGDLFRADIRLYANDMKKALADHYGIGIGDKALGNIFTSGKIPNSDLKKIDSFMQTGEGLSRIPEPLRESVMNLRMHIDKMTGAALKVGLFEGDVKTAVENNIGTYIYRTYKKHEYPDTWTEKAPADVRNSAKSWMFNQYKDAGYRPTEAELDEMVRQLLLTDDGPVNILASDAVVRKRVADLKGRTEFRLRDPNNPKKTLKKYDEVPQPIQELWGVETNPFINYLNSVSKIANLTQNHKTLSDLRVLLGEGAGDQQIFFDPAKTDPETKTRLDLRQLTKEDDISLAPLDGMWTTPEMKQALLKMNESNADRGNLYRWAMQGNAMAKISATVLSPRTFVRNIPGSYLFLPAQGHILPTNIKESADLTLSIFRNPDSPEARSVLRAMSRFGLMERSPKGSEMRALVKDFKGKDTGDRMVLDFVTKGKASNISRLIERGVMKASDAYQLSDTFFRLQMFQLEKLRYQKKGIEVTDEQVAELTHNLYQDYSQVSKGLRNLRKNVFLAPFITFYTEVVRTSGNTVRQISHELKSDNPKIKEIGYERMAGLTLFAGLGSAATAEIGKMIFGIGTETLDAMRDWSAPWNKKATLVPVDVFNGGGRYVNLTYTDPYEIVKEPIYQFVRDRNEVAFHQNVLNSILKVAEPAMSPELFTKASTEALIGRTLDGRPLIKSGDTMLEQTTDRIAHVFSALEPGAVDQIGQIYESFGSKDPWAKTEAFSSLFGQNMVKIDVREQMPYAIQNYQRRNRALRSSYLDNAREGTYTENINDLQRVNQEKMENFKEMQKKMRSAFKLGLTYPDLKILMNESGMSEEAIRNLWIDRFEPFEVHMPTDR